MHIVSRGVCSYELVEICVYASNFTCMVALISPSLILLWILDNVQNADVAYDEQV